MSTVIILTLISISNGQGVERVEVTEKPAGCNYVYPIRYTIDQSQPYAVDVCRTIVTNGIAEYRKYICDGNTIKDEVYDEEGCGGNLIDTLTPTIDESVCDYIGSCSYIMVKSPCDNPSNYTIQPVLTNVCIQDYGFEQYFWDCTGARANGVAARFQFLTLYSNTPCARSDLALEYDIAIDECVDYQDDDTKDPMMSMDSECRNVYYGPTSEPTMDPTGDPTMEPTYMPSGNPTVNPTTAEPTTAEPSSSPTVPEGDGVAHIAMIVNVIVVMVMVLFSK